MKGHLGQALPGPPNGLADLESAGGPVASQGPTPHPAAPVPYGPTVPVRGPGRIGVALSTGPPGATRRVASILWSGAVTPPPPSTEHMFLYHTLPHVRNCNLKTEQPLTPSLPPLPGMDHISHQWTTPTDRGCQDVLLLCKLRMIQRTRRRNPVEPNDSDRSAPSPKMAGSPSELGGGTVAVPACRIRTLPCFRSWE